MSLSSERAQTGQLLAQRRGLLARLGAVKMPAAAADRRRATKLTEHEADVGVALEHAAVRHEEDAQRVRQEVPQPRVQKGRLAQPRRVAPARPGAARMHRAGHVEGPRQLEDLRKARVVQRHVAIVGQQRNATHKRQPQVAFELRDAFRSAERIDGGRRQKTTVASRCEIIRHGPVVSTDDVDHRFVLTSEGCGVVRKAEDQPQIDARVVHHLPQLVEIGPAWSVGRIRAAQQAARRAGNARLVEPDRLIVDVAVDAVDAHHRPSCPMPATTAYAAPSGGAATLPARKAATAYAPARLAETSSSLHRSLTVSWISSGVARTMSST